uniref:ubiquitinyl hydrolase 1 n=1 Tax=Echinococcus granulosus TaxID=6210 RepID=A0A068X0W8_ECHGR|nr:ubiquitin carboxyl terminal hydrolase 20 [Echinococcus granulosus]
MSPSFYLLLKISHPFTKLFFARVQTLPITSQVPLSKAYLGLLFEMGHLEDQEDVPRPTWPSYRRSAASPYNVLDVIRISYPMFRGVFQHDSQEFMRAFLSDIHDELKFRPFDDSKFPCTPTPAGCTTLNSNSVTDGNRNLCKRPAKNKRPKKRKTRVTRDESPANESSSPLSSSPVMDVFQGGTVTCIKCLSCEKIFHRNEVFLDLSLPIATSQSKPKITDTTQLPPSTPPSPLLPPPPPRLPPPITTTAVSSSSVVTSSKQFLGNSDSEGFFYWASFYLLLAIAWLKSVPPIPLVASYMALITSWVKRSALSWGYTTPGVGNNLIWNPQIELEDCLDAFFDVDELSGENQYYCENCSRHTNGRMHMELTKLPEVLCLHLKRFRHDFINTSKIHAPVNFPMQHLDLRKYRHSSCRDKVCEYDLVGVVCHSGTVRFGHYYTYALNFGDGEWYEFNDSSVQHVDADTVTSLSSAAYVLFYRKRQDFIQPIREKFTISESPQVVYISVHWLLRFSEFADPGPITNSDFLCNHGALQPLLAPAFDKHVAAISEDVWNFLSSQFGGGPFVTTLHPCKVCVEKLEILDARRQAEREAFQEAEKESEFLFIINLDWFNAWADFVCRREIEPPGPISNSVILEVPRAVPGTYRIRFGIAPTKYDWLTQPQWAFLFSIYGGGPEFSIRNSSYSEKKAFEAEEGKVEAMDGIEYEQEAEGDVLRADTGLEEIDNKSSSSTSLYPVNDEPFSSVRGASSLSLSPMMENSPMAGTGPLESVLFLKSPLFRAYVQPRSASVACSKPESPFAGDVRSQSVNDFSLLNGDRTSVRSSSPLQSSAFGDAAECTGFNRDKKMEWDGALRELKETLPNGAVNGEREKEKGEEEEEVCQESLVA